MLRLLLVALVASVLLEALARSRRGAWSAWARGVLTWSGLLWTALALLFAAAFVFSPDTRSGDDLPRLLAGSVAMALLLGGGFFTAGFLTDRLARRGGMPSWLRHGLVLASSVPGVLAGLALYAVATWWAFGTTPFWAETSGISRMFSSIVLWLVSSAAVFVGFVRLLYDLRLDALAERERRLEAEATAARLLALEGQLRPHVLFNALSGLAGLIPDDPARAEAMALALARLLRQSLGGGSAATVPLRDEIAFARDYLDVERYRLGDRLRTTLDIGDDVLGWPVPRFALQPLVENAVKHGAGARAGDVSVAVSARRVGDTLELAVEDDGPPFADGWMAGTGLGSVRERLALLYGDRAALTVRDAPKRVVLTLPR